MHKERKSLLKTSFAILEQEMIPRASLVGHESLFIDHLYDLDRLCFHYTNIEI